MGRKKLWAERVLIALAEGTLARIDAVLAPGEVRLDFIRTAIARELRRRERSPALRSEAMGNNGPIP